MIITLIVQCWHCQEKIGVFCAWDGKSDIPAGRCGKCGVNLGSIPAQEAHTMLAGRNAIESTAKSFQNDDAEVPDFEPEWGTGGPNQ